MSTPAQDVWAGLESAPQQQAQPNVWDHLETGQVAAANPSQGIAGQLWDTAKSIPGMAAHAAGTMVDIAENAYHGIRGEPTISPGSPESMASRLSSPFTPNGNNPDTDTDIKQQKIAKGDVNFALPQGPFRQTLEEYGPQAVEAIGTVAGARSAIASRLESSAAKSAAAQIETGHPLTDVAQAEQARIEGHRTVAQEAGVPITPRGVSPAQQFVDNSANHDLNLPKNSPVTSDLITAGIKENAAPAWDNVRATPEYQLGSKYQAAIKKVDLSQIEPEFRPPTSGSMTGDQAADLSPQLRSVARGQFQDAENPNLTYAQRQAARQSAQAHYQAAKAVEAGFRENAEKPINTGTEENPVMTPGDPSVADAWDKARVYQAKAEAWRGALDGAGHVIAPKIKKIMLADEPMSPDMSKVASVAASDPELFKSTRLQTPPEGLTKKVVKAVAPMAGAALGGMIPFPGGPEVGAGAGQWLANKIAR